MTPEDLKAWHKKHGYTQPSLARVLGIHPLSVARWETGVRKIPSFLHLALEALERKRGESKQGHTKTKREKSDGINLPKR
jgi:DNA-binding transcriptional regulator YiaG